MLKPCSLLALAGLLLAACDDGAPPAEDPPGDAGPGADAVSDAAPDAASDASPPRACATRQLLDLESETVALWPDPRLLAPSRTLTGYRLDPDPARHPWIAAAPAIIRDTLGDLAALNGFARTGSILLSFDAPVVGLPEDLAASLAPESAAVILDVTARPPVRIPFQIKRLDEDRALVLSPAAPLAPATRYVALLGPGITDLAGGCVQAAPALASLGEWGEDIAAAAAHQGWAVGSLAAATAFITQDARAPLHQAADTIRRRSYAWSGPLACAPQDEAALDGPRRCEGSFEALDFRSEERAILDGAGGRPWQIPVTLWLPPAGAGPHPTVLYGHGIGSRRQEAAGVARLLNPEGFAVVAIDALRHGAHPTGEPDSTASLSFLGLDIRGPRVDGLALRGNFNQTVLDRLQLIELLRQAPDLDGDGAPELDASRMGYWGISLGGLTGVGLLALSDDLGAGILSVAGGGLISFVTETEQIRPFRPALYNLAGGQTNLERSLVALQSLVDAADPALWAAHTLRDRWRGEAPHVLLPVALDDETVPPLTAEILARALALPHLEPVARPVAGLSPLAAPARATVGAATAAYFQLDRVGGPPREATHGNAPTSPEAALQAVTFLNSWLDGDAVIIDPYAALGTPPLP